MKFSELTCCPFCGNEEYYLMYHAEGPGFYNFRLFYNFRFDEEEPRDNTEMNSSLSYSGGKSAYCNVCNKYLGDVTKDIAGVDAAEAASHPSDT